MTHYFMQDTPLFHLERQMMTPPNFKPRGHGRYSPGFQYSNEDTECQYIITKSVSRFARNTVDCLDHVRMLRARGIGIYFEEQNIDTLQIDSELYLVIYAGFA